MKNILTVLGYAIAIVLAVLLFRQCENGDRLAENVEVQKDSVSYLKLKNGQLAAEKRAYTATEEEMRKQIWVKDDSLQALLKIYKNPQVVYRINTVTEIDTVKIPFEVPVETSFSRTFKKDHEYYSIAGDVNQSGINFDRISIPNTQRIVTGVKRGWFKNEITTTITNSNPFIETQEIDTQTQSVRNKRFGLGAFVGYDLINGNVAAGPSLNVNLFEF